MGFKLKKKNGSVNDSSGLKKGSAFLEKIRTQLISFHDYSVKLKIETDSISCD
jgi:hypothetical protein